MSGPSLRVRTVVLVAVTTATVCAALIATGYRLSTTEVEQAVRGRARAVVDQIELADSDASPFLTQESVRRLHDSRAFVGAVVFSPGREMLAAVPPSVSQSPLLAGYPMPETGLHRVEVDGVPSVAVFIPLDDGGRAWLVFDRSPYATAHRQLRTLWIAIGVGAVLLASLVAFAAGSGATRRIRELESIVDRLGDGELEARVKPTGPSDVRQLGDAINRMATKVGQRIQRLDQERSALEQQVTGRTRELEQANRLLMDIANRDALTGLANRRRLEMELERNISFSKRTGQPLAVIMMDLDRFKVCNDTAGHLVGDNILRAVASTLRSRVRVTDLVVRWGGDEFCILVPATQPQGAIAAAESLVDAVREATAAVPLPEGLEPPTASAGVACFPEDGEDPHTLILNADAALYRVKATGRGRVLRFEPGFSKD